MEKKIEEINYKEIFDKFKKINWEHEYAEMGIMNRNDFERAVKSIIQSTPSLPTDEEIEIEADRHYPYRKDADNSHFYHEGFVDCAKWLRTNFSSEKCEGENSNGLTETDILRREIKSLKNKLGYAYGKAFILYNTRDIFKNDSKPTDLHKLWDCLEDCKEYYKNL